MSASSSDSPRGDDAAGEARLAKDVEEAEAELARLTAENARLRTALGEPAGEPARAGRPRGGSKRAASAYRGADARAALEEAFGAANSAIASLSIDNSILQSRLAEKGPARGAGVGRAILVAGLVFVAVAAGVAVAVDPKASGPTALIVVTIGIALYASYGWFLVFTSLPRYLQARRVSSRAITPIVDARAGRSIVVSGTVQARDTAFDAWFPDRVRAVWQSVEVIDARGRRREHLARRRREADFFHLEDADGDRVRVEPAGAEIVPEELTSSGYTLSRMGRRELDAIGGILGERDELTIQIELVRLGATVQIEGCLSDDPAPVMRSTKKTPLRIVVLASDGVDDATRFVRQGLPIGTLAGAATIGLCLVIARLLNLV